MHQPEVVLRAARCHVEALLEHQLLTEAEPAPRGPIDHREEHDVALVPLELRRIAGGEAAPLRFAIAVRQQAASLPVSGGASRIAWAGAYAWRAFEPGEGLAVSAATETYFARPRSRDDGKDEKPTLFRPYWQAHRAAASAGEESMAHGAMR